MIDYGKKNITIHSDNFLGNEIDKETLRPITENHFFSNNKYVFHRE